MSASRNLSESWGFVDHDSPAPDSDADDDMYDSEDYIPEPPRKRISPRRSSTTPQRQVRHSPRAVRSYTSNRSTPSRRTPQVGEVPAFVMPTPEHTPIPVKRQTRRRVSPQQPTPTGQKIRTPKRARVQQESAQRWLYLFSATLFRIGLSALEIGGIVLSLLKYPLAIMLVFISIRAMVVSMIPSFAFPNFLPGFDMIPSTCSIPVVNRLIPGCGSTLNTEPPNPNTLQEFRKVHDSFEKVLDTVIGNSIHSNHLSFGKVMIDELRDLVKFQSSLPSKPELIHEISEFSRQSSDVSLELATFNSHINRAVDAVISLNRRTLASLGDLKTRSKMVDLAASMIPWIFSADNGPVTASDVIRQYLNHASDVESKIDALISEGSVLSLHLQNMENGLEMIRETANKDQASFIDKKEVLFAKLWTRLGGNARDRHNIEKNIHISQILASSSKGAWLLVDSVLRELHMVKHDIQDLRSRIAGPRNRAVMSAAEIEEHIAYVQDAQDRLMEGRTKSRNELARRNADTMAAVYGVFAGEEDSLLEGKRKPDRIGEK